MKHPALARMFAVILAVVSLISVLSGVKGFSDTEKDNAKAVADADRLEKRKNIFAETDALLAEKLSYSELNSGIDADRDQHNTDASAHRTDVATYSASKGGYTMGADMLWEAKAELAGAKAQFEQAKKKLVEVETMKAAMSASADECNAAAAKCDAAAANLSECLSALGTAISSKPAEPEMPIEPTPPETVEEPEMPEPPSYKGEEEPTRVEEPENENAEDWAAYEAYLTSYNEWAMQCFGVLARVDASSIEEAAGAGSAAISNALAVMPSEMQEMMGAMGSAGDIGVPDISGIQTPEEAYAALAGAQGSMSMLSGALRQISGGLTQAIAEIDNQMAASLAEMGAGAGVSIPEGADAATIIAIMENMMKQGEAEIETGLANIWYELGQLDEDKAELEENKARLDTEAAELEQRQTEADEIRELENRRTGARVVLTRVEEIKTAVDAGEYIVDAAEKYIAEYRLRTEQERENGVKMSWLAVAAGALGLLAIPAAFELIKNRFMLLVPPLLCLAGAGYAMWLSRGVSDTLFYASMLTAIIAAAHLLVILPKQKEIV